MNFKVHQLPSGETLNFGPTPTPHPAEILQGCAWLGHRLAAEGGHNNGIKFGTLKISFKGETMGKRRLNLFREFWGIPSSDKSKNMNMVEIFTATIPKAVQGNVRK